MRKLLLSWIGQHLREESSFSSTQAQVGIPTKGQGQGGRQLRIKGGRGLAGARSLLLPLPHVWEARSLH